MRALSLRQAGRCEAAQHEKCRCRCHGIAHGRQREREPASLSREFFEALPIDDPHRLPTDEERKAANKAANKARRS